MRRFEKFNEYTSNLYKKYVYIKISSKFHMLVEAKDLAFSRTDNHTLSYIKPGYEILLDVPKGNFIITDDDIKPTIEGLHTYLYRFNLTAKDSVCIETLEFEQNNDAQLFFELLR